METAIVEELTAKIEDFSGAIVVMKQT